MASFCGEILFVLSYSLSFLPIVNRSCNGGLCFQPSCIIRDIINPVPEPASALFGSWPWHWIHIAVPPGAIGSSSFLPPFQAISVCAGGIRGKSTPSSQQPACLSPCWHRGIESQVTPASAWVCDFRAVYTLELLFYFWSIKTFTCFWAWQYVGAVLNRSLLTCLEPGR